MALAKDVVGSSHNNTATSLALTITTTVDNTWIVVGVTIERTDAQGSYVTVSSITDNAGGLTWTQRGQKQAHPAVNTYVNLETWYAKWTSHGSITVTANLSGTGDNECMEGIAISGADPTNPWDPNANAKVTNSGNTSTPGVTGQSTTNANTVLLIFGGNGGGSWASETGASGFSNIALNVVEQGGTARCCMQGQYEIVSSAQSSLATSFAQTSINDWVMIGDAIQAPAASAKLFRQSLLNGLGSGGPFFSNPLGRSMLGWRKRLGIWCPEEAFA